MPGTFWIGLAIVLTGTMLGFLFGARSRGTATKTGLAIGAFMGLMAGFPLLAIGLSTS
jgi:hypothetical protein